MRHQKKTIKLGRTASHRKALLANQICNLIEHERIQTTLAKAKAVRPLAERMVTFGKNGSLHARRMVLATLRHKDVVKKLFDDIAPRLTDRNGGYTRIVRLGRRKSDSAPMAFIEWVEAGEVIEEQPVKEKKAKRKEPKPEPEPEPEITEEEAAPEEPTAEETIAEETTAEETVVEEEEEAEPDEAAAPPPEEPKPKKRRWFRKW